MTEFEETVVLANRILERPNADPDDDLSMLARQFLRQVEWNDRVFAEATRIVKENGGQGDGGHTIDRLICLAARLKKLSKAVEDLKRDLAAQHDPMGDLIQANRDQLLKMHEEAVRRMRGLLDKALNGEFVAGPWRWEVIKARNVIDALNLFHPMHPESFPGWPEGSE